MIQIKYPKYLANTLKLNAKDFELEMKVSSLVKLYELGKISSGVAAKVLNISRVEFLELLSKYKVSIFETYNEDDLSEDIVNA
ncbi:UPF0175 family protein [Psychroflexus planctonicus]|uniref:Uncharacterized protein n=1 Tax=Psychroflexus planctonicus TaxID=1526575 RepID=A0ABQ1SL89_9FLAO|nr:UPF0175 family protein [Psychroflexus planctonicus]GGE41678.1 hypothetical protein GCM10010832_22130 [Psychroflexus planctonicus]